MKVRKNTLRKRTPALPRSTTSVPSASRTTGIMAAGANVDTAPRRGLSCGMQRTVHAGMWHRRHEASALVQSSAQAAMSRVLLSACGAVSYTEPIASFTAGHLQTEFKDGSACRQLPLEAIARRSASITGQQERTECREKSKPATVLHDGHTGLESDSRYHHHDVRRRTSPLQTSEVGQHRCKRAQIEEHDM